MSAVNEKYDNRYCNSSKKPLFEGVLKYSGGNPVIFHMPGHKQQTVFGENFDSQIIKLDVTETNSTDNLHNPSSIIAQAQKMAAFTFGSDESFFIVNGSTTGVHAMVLAVCNEGDKILLARDCHKSAVNSIILSGAEPVYIAAGFDDNFCVPLPPTVEDVKAAVEKHSDARAVFITRPNYYGICCDLKSIANIVHEAGMVLIVDEAHGAHFVLSQELPEPALKCGADICVQSTHKTLPAFTQTAILHVKSNRVDLEKLKFYLRMLQTSSPSYILMSSIDCCRDFVCTEGKKRMSWLLKRIFLLKGKVDKLNKIKMLWQLNEKEFDRDYTRLVFNVSAIGLTGFKAIEVLTEKYNLHPEMGDLHNIVCISTICDKDDNFETLSNALEYLDNYCCGSPFYEQAQSNQDEVLISTIKGFWKANNVKKGICPRQICKYEWSKIKLEHSEGYVSCSVITPYPPGIPVVMPGEIIDKEHIFIITTILRKGGLVEGVDKEGYITVVKNL